MATLTQTMKDYLKAIYSLEGKRVYVKTTDLAQLFSVAPASVTEMLQKMAAEGFLYYEPYHGVRLTVQGRKTVMRILRGHRLIEKLLVDFVGLDAPTACKEASKLELVLTDRVVNGICRAFNHPTVCPHGEPIFKDKNCCGGS